MSNHLVIGNQDGSTVAFQPQSDKTIEIDPLAYGLNIETIDFEDINNSSKNNENNQENLSIQNEEVISDGVIELNFEENTEENLSNQKEKQDLEFRAVQDSPIEPPVGKVN